MKTEQSIKHKLCRKQNDNDFVLHMTNAFRGGIFPTYTDYNWVSSCHFFTYHRGQLGDYFAILNSDYVKVAVNSFVQITRELFTRYGIIKTESDNPNTSVLLSVFLWHRILTMGTDRKWEYGCKRNVVFKYDSKQEITIRYKTASILTLIIITYTYNSFFIYSVSL